MWGIISTKGIIKSRFKRYALNKVSFIEGAYKKLKKEYLTLLEKRKIW